jgi:hypothetical protein
MILAFLSNQSSVNGKILGLLTTLDTLLKNPDQAAGGADFKETSYSSFSSRRTSCLSVACRLRSSR